LHLWGKTGELDGSSGNSIPAIDGLWKQNLESENVKAKIKEVKKKVVKEGDEDYVKAPCSSDAFGWGSRAFGGEVG